MPFFGKSSGKTRTAEVSAQIETALKEVEKMMKGRKTESFTPDDILNGIEKNENIAQLIYALAKIQYSQENVDYINAYYRLLESSDTDSFKDSLQAILTQYVRQGAPDQVNVSYTKIKSSLKAIDAAIRSKDDAQIEEVAKEQLHSLAFEAAKLLSEGACKKPLKLKSDKSNAHLVAVFDASLPTEAEKANGQIIDLVKKRISKQDTTISSGTGGKKQREATRKLNFYNFIKDACIAQVSEHPERVVDINSAIEAAGRALNDPKQFQVLREGKRLKECITASEKIKKKAEQGARPTPTPGPGPAASA